MDRPQRQADSDQSCDAHSDDEELPAGRIGVVAITAHIDLGEWARFHGTSRAAIIASAYTNDH